MTRVLIGTLLALPVCGLPIAAGEPDLVPNIRQLDREEAKPDLGNTVRLFENVIDTARTSSTTVAEGNLAYNSERKQEIADQLAARDGAMAKLDDVVSIQYDRIRSQFGDDVPEDLSPAIRQLYQQHQVTRSRLEEEVNHLNEDLVTVENRLLRNAVDREIARLNRQLANPRDTYNVKQAIRKRESARQQDAAAYLDKLSDQRVTKRLAQIGLPSPSPMMPAIIQHLERTVK